MIRKTTTGQQIAAALRKRILSGRWAPGTKLPKREVLVRELDSCLATVQLAVRQLTKEGFLTVGPRKFGTLVAVSPPHLCRYRVIFPHEPNDWGQFWRALEVAVEQKSRPERQFACFYGFRGHRDIADYQEIIREVEDGRVAGLIFASGAYEFEGTPLIEHPGVPRVAIAQKGELPGVPKIQLDLLGFAERSLDFLHAQGRTRIALLCADDSRFVLELFLQAMKKRGLRVPTMWQQFSSRHFQENALHVTELMFHRNQRERPDGLIIADDNFLTAATQGIAAAGVRVPDDLTVVGLTNFPNILPTHVPVTRLGFDIPDLLDDLVVTIETLIGGESPEEHVVQPALFEDELGG